MYSIAKAHDSYFVLLDIPPRNLKPAFPLTKDADLNSCADMYINAAQYLKEYKGKGNLYRLHGQGHWSEISHLIVGTKIGEKLLEKFKKYKQFSHMRRVQQTL